MDVLEEADSFSRVDVWETSGTTEGHLAQPPTQCLLVNYPPFIQLGRMTLGYCSEKEATFNSSRCVSKPVLCNT